MPIELGPAILAESRSILMKDQELWSLATQQSIEAAGSVLGRRAEPNIENLAGIDPLWKAFKREVRKLLCTDEGYPELRKQLQKVNDVTKDLLVPMIAVAVGAHLNLEAGLVTPFVALGLLGTAQLGTQAWCKSDTPQDVPMFKDRSTDGSLKIDPQNAQPKIGSPEEPPRHDPAEQSTEGQ
jgi:hypothetical protein